MNRLDRHVSAVRNKLAVHRFVEALAVTVLCAAIAGLVSVLVERALGYKLPVGRNGWLIGAGVLLTGAVIYAIGRRPGARQAAVAIDRALNLDEKFSTALYARTLNDPFARAAVRDAEWTAMDVRLERQFPLKFPRRGYSALTVAAAGVIAFLLMPNLDLLGHKQAAAAKKKAVELQAVDATKRVERALEVVQSAPPSLLNDEAFQIKVRELKEMAKQGRADDASRVSRKAEDVLKDVEKSLKDEADRTQLIADKQTAAFTQSLGEAGDSKSPVAKVEKAMADGDFSAAVQSLEKMVDQFDKLDDKEKKDAAKDMQKLADKLEKSAQDPKVQDQIKKQLQQMGADPQQAQQMAQNMAQAAQGNKQAAQQLQQQAQQMQQQLQKQIQQAQQQAAAGNQQAAQQLAQLQQQQQAMNQAIQGMQGMANAQAQAGNMAQAAQQMAAGMKQAGQQGGAPPPGQQPGQQGNKPGQQQVAQGKQQMQQALGQMQAAQADANQAAARQQAAQQAGQPGDGQGDGGPQANGQPKPADGKGGGEGEFQPGDPNQNPGGQGMGGPGQANGGQTRNKQFAPFTAKAEDDLGVSNEDGKILASTLVKGQIIRGEAKAGLAKITESREKAISDEVEEDHVSGLSRKAAEEYFRVMNQDAKK